MDGRECSDAPREIYAAQADPGCHEVALASSAHGTSNRLPIQRFYIKELTVSFSELEIFAVLEKVSARQAGT